MKFGKLLGELNKNTGEYFENKRAKTVQCRHGKKCRRIETCKFRHEEETIGIFNKASGIITYYPIEEVIGEIISETK